MQAIQLQCLQLTLGVECQRAIELQRIGVIQPQPAHLERPPLRAGPNAKLDRMIGQLGVKRAQQQLAAAQAGIHVHPCRAIGGIEAEAAAAAQSLPGQGAGRGVKAYPGQGEAPG